MSRRELAERLRVDVSSVSGWEAGKRLPRDAIRKRLASALGVNLQTLSGSAVQPVAGTTAAIVDTMTELHDLLLDLTARARSLRAIRLAAPYITPSHIQVEWRNLISKRIMLDQIEVQRVEAFYDIQRLKEIVSNIFRYEGKQYFVKAYLAPVGEVMPAMGGYFFDREEYLIGAYWTGVPPRNKPGLRMSGLPVQTYFDAYWDEIWNRGRFLNIRGPHELSKVKHLALKLGLEPDKWDEFVEDARTLEVGDGAPPLP